MQTLPKESDSNFHEPIKHGPWIINTKSIANQSEATVMAYLPYRLSVDNLYWVFHLPTYVARTFVRKSPPPTPLAINKALFDG